MQCQPGAGRDVELGARRPYGTDQTHQPAELRLGPGVDKISVEARPLSADQQAAGPAEQLLPQLLSDERCDRMQQVESLRQHPGGGVAGLRLRLGLVAEKQGFGQLDVPVAEGVPEKVVEPKRGIVESVGLERARDRRGRLLGLTDDPAVEGLPTVARIEARAQTGLVELHEAGGVPELGDEIAVALDPARAELDVAALRGRGEER